MKRWLPALVMLAFLAACSSPEEKVEAYLDRAEQLLEEENLTKAELEAKNALQIDPNNPRGRLILAEIAEQQQDVQEMVGNLRAAVEADPTLVEARVKLATIFIAAGLRDEAQKLVEEAAAREPSDPGVRVVQARLTIADGDVAGGAAELRDIVATHPDNTAAFALLASVVAVEDPDAALDILDQGVKSVEEPRSLRLIRIEILQREGRDADVRSEYQALIAAYPDETAYRYRLAQFLLQSGDIDGAEQELRALAEAQTDDVTSRLALVQFLANVRGAEAAEQALEELIAKKPEPELELALGRLYEATGRSDDAKAIYESLRASEEQNDSGLEASNRLARMAIVAGDTEDGREIIESTLIADPSNAEALIMRSALHIQDEKFRSAVTDLRTLLRAEPDNLRGNYLLARAHRAAGDMVLAKDAYRRVIELDTSNAMAPLELAQIEYQEGRPGEAESVLKDRVDAAPADLQAGQVLVTLLLEQEKTAQARREAQRIADLPDSPAAGDFLLGRVELAADNPAAAEENFRAALEKAPASPQPLQALVATLIQQDKRDEAVAFLEAHIEQYPDQEFAKNLLGRVVAGSGDIEAAEAIFANILEDNAQSVASYVNLAGLKGDDLGAQIEVYEQGLQAVPGSQQLGLLLGTAYERTGRIDEAIAMYRGVLEQNPESPAVANNLAALLSDYRSDAASYREALELAEQFADSENPAFLDTLGWAHYRSGNYDEAVEYLQKSVAAAPNVAVLRYHLGMAHYANGREMLAQQELDRSLELAEADFKGIEEARATLKKITGGE